jgi:hypothetical protein
LLIGPSPYLRFTRAERQFTRLLTCLGHYFVAVTSQSWAPRNSAKLREKLPGTFDSPSIRKKIVIDGERGSIRYDMSVSEPGGCSLGLPSASALLPVSLFTGAPLKVEAIAAVISRVRHFANGDPNRGWPTARRSRGQDAE